MKNTIGSKNLNAATLLQKNYGDAFKSHKQMIEKDGMKADSESEDDNAKVASEENFSEDEDTRKLRKEVVRQRDTIHRER